MISLKKDVSILLYEKEKILNSILQYQISNYNKYDVFVLENHEDLHEILINRSFDVCIWNLNNFSNDIKHYIDILRSKNENINIIVYHDPFFQKKFDNEGKLFLLEKPFKLATLLNCLDNINNSETLNNSNKYLMDHIIFSPSKKIISNLETNFTEHLTEK